METQLLHPTCRPDPTALRNQGRFATRIRLNAEVVTLSQRTRMTLELHTTKYQPTQARLYIDSQTWDPIFNVLR